MAGDPNGTAVVALLVRDLAKSVCEGTGGERFEDRMWKYGMSILSSSLGPGLQCDDLAVSAAARRQLTAAGKEGEIARFESLVRRLLRTRMLRRPWELLHVLHTIGVANNAHRSLVVQPVRWTQPNLNDSKPARGSNVTNGSSHALTPIVSPSPSLGGSRELAATPVGTVLGDSLIRDVLYSFQGVDGESVRFDQASSSFVVQCPPSLRIARPVRTLTEVVCEMGWLYRQVTAYVDDKGRGNDAGLVCQSFAAALREEVNEYYRLLALLDGQAGTASREDKLTLHRLLVWVHEPMERLKVMAMLTHAAKELKGGRLASVLHEHKHHGDPAVRELVHRVMRKTCVPLFRMIGQWIFDGVLHDAQGEFFVTQQAVDDDRMWTHKYTLNDAMRPSFISEDVAHKILTTGKAIHFIRGACNDNEWVLNHASLNADTMLVYGNESGIESTVSGVAQKTQHHLLELLFEQNKLGLHARAIKRYLLLGQGDFATHLIDMLGPELSKPSHQIFNHNLSGILESSVRASNAQYDDPDVLAALDATLITRADGSKGWDVFSLSYHVQSPITIVLTPVAIKQYAKLFDFIWKLKRVTRALSRCWAEDMAANKWSRALMRAVPESENFYRSLHAGHILRDAMQHFVKQLEYYFMFEVLECSWLKFEKAMQTAKDLDEVINAHNQYLSHITRQILLNAPGEGHRGIAAQEMPGMILLEMFVNMLNFCQIQDVIFQAQKRASDLLLRQRKLRQREGQGPGKAVEIANLLTLPQKYLTTFEAVKQSHAELLQRFCDALESVPDSTLRALIAEVE